MTWCRRRSSPRTSTTTSRTRSSPSRPRPRKRKTRRRPRRRNNRRLADKKAPHLGENLVDALLVDEAQARAGEAHLHPAVLALDPEAAVLQVGQVAALGFIVGVGHVVSDSGGLPRDLANASHGLDPIEETKR